MSETVRGIKFHAEDLYYTSLQNCFPSSICRFLVDMIRNSHKYALAQRICDMKLDDTHRPFSRKRRSFLSPTAPESIFTGLNQFRYSDAHDHLKR
jgi:hypothetical protein